MGILIVGHIRQMFTINNLQSVGDVLVQSGIQSAEIISGMTTSVSTDGTVASLTGGDLQQHLSPGDGFRIGGLNNEIDGAEIVGSGS